MHRATHHTRRIKGSDREIPLGVGRVVGFAGCRVFARVHTTRHNVFIGSALIARLRRCDTHVRPRGTSKPCDKKSCQ